MDFRISSLVRGKDLLRSTPSAQRDQQSDPPHPFGQGRYQIVALFNSVLAGVSFLGHIFCVRLASRVMDHWCQPPDVFANLSVAEWKEIAIPLTEDGRYSQCTARDPPDAGEFARVLPCVSWTFDTDEYGGNIVSEWRLVCDQGWQLNASIGIYGVAAVIWLPILGSAADRVGRRIVAILVLPALLLAGFATAFTRSFVLFVALRLVVSETAAALALILLTLLYEAAVPAWRTPICFLAGATMHVAATGLFSAIGPLKLPWRVVILIAMLPTALQISMPCTVYESYSWLTASCRIEEAERAALHAAKMNGVTPDVCWAALNKVAQVNQGRCVGCVDRKKLTVFSRELGMHCFLFGGIWFAVHYCYSQLYLTDTIPLDAHAALAGVFCLAPAYALHYALVLRFGTRRTTVASALIFSIASIFLAGSYNRLKNTVAGSALVAFLRVLASVIAALSLCLPIQAFPTTTRCIGLSLCFAIGWVVGTTVHLALYHVPIRRRDAILFSMPLLMALTAAAVQNLPYIPGDDPESSRPTSVASKEDVRRSYSDSLVPLPKGPMNRRKTEQMDDMPEQLALRLSRLSLGSVTERSSYWGSSSSHRYN